MNCGVMKMRADKEKLKIAVARACMSIGGLAAAAGLPYPSTKNVLYGRSVKPRTLGKVARALNCDVAALLEEAQQEQ